MILMNIVCIHTLFGITYAATQTSPYVDKLGTFLSLPQMVKLPRAFFKSLYQLPSVLHCYVPRDLSLCQPSNTFSTPSVPSSFSRVNKHLWWAHPFSCFNEHPWCPPFFPVLMNTHGAHPFSCFNEHPWCPPFFPVLMNTHGAHPCFLF